MYAGIIQLYSYISYYDTHGHKTLLWKNLYIGDPILLLCYV